MLILHLILNGFKRIRDTKTPRMAINDDILKQFMNFLDFSQYNDLVLFCALVFKKMAVLRSSEDSPNNVHELGATPNMLKWTYTNGKKSGLIFSYKKSKTNQHRNTLRVDIPCVCLHNHVCAVHWINKLLHRRKFRSYNEPLFQLDSGRIINGKYLLHHIKRLAKLCNLDPSLFVVHSLRSGGASDYLAWGVPHWIVQQLGQWKDPKSMDVYQKLDSKDMLSLMFKCFT